MSSPNKFKTIQGDHGRDTSVKVPSTCIDSEQLTGIADNPTGESLGTIHSVPSEAGVVIFSAESDFYAKPNNLPVIPTGSESDGAAGELNPASWALKSTDVTVTGIGLVAEVNNRVTLAFYK